MTTHMKNELRKFVIGETDTFDPAIYAYINAVINMYENQYTEKDYDALFDELNDGSIDLSLNDGSFAKVVSSLDQIHENNK